MSGYDELYQLYGEKVYRYLLNLSHEKELAEELTQETFYQAFLHSAQFKEKCSILTWLCQIGKNAFFKEIKRRNRMTQKVQEISNDTDSLLDELMDTELKTRIHQILHKMEEPYREVFILKVFAELKFREICALFAKSESWAKLTYYRAKEKIVRELEEFK